MIASANEHMAGTTLPIPQKEKPFEWGEKVLVWRKGEEEQKEVAIFIHDNGDKFSWLRYVVIVQGDFEISSWSYCKRA